MHKSALWWLVLVVFAGGCGQGPIEDAMRYLPNNCRVVATANVDELMRSSIYQQMKKNPPNAENGQWDGFDPGVGIPPSNISRFTWAWGGPLDDADAVAIIRLKKAASAADIKTNTKVEAHKRDFQFREVAVGSIAVFEETYRSAFRDAKAERLHGLAFCVPESTLVVVCTKLEVLKEILQRGKPPQLSEGMHDAMNEANCSKTMAMAFSVKGLPRTRLLDCVTALAGNAFFGGLPSRTDLSAFTEDVVGLAADISLDSSQPTLIATLLCKDAEHAANAKRMLDSARATMRNGTNEPPALSSEAAATAGSLELVLSGAKVQGSLPASCEILGKLAALPKDIVRAMMETRVLRVGSGPTPRGGVSPGGPPTLTPADAEEITRQCPAIAQAAPVVRTVAQVCYGNRNRWATNTYGTTPAFLAIRDWGNPSEGDAFTDLDVRSAAKVCLVGKTIQREVFQGNSPVGKEIRIQNVSFKVVGVLRSKGTNAFGMDQDDVVIAPWTTIRYRVTGPVGTAATRVPPRRPARPIP